MRHPLPIARTSAYPYQAASSPTRWVSLRRADPPSSTPRFLSLNRQPRIGPAAGNAGMRCSLGDQHFDFQIIISMSLPVGLGEGWPELLNLKREQYLSQCGERIITSKLTSRDDFVRKVIEVADEKNEPDTQREVVRLQKEYRHVQKFAAAAGRRDGQVTQEQLLSLVWDASFALIMVCVRVDMIRRSITLMISNS